MSGVQSRPGTCIGRYPHYVAIAEMAWNQGDSLYIGLNNRLLLGLEWNYRYNLSKVRAYEEQKEPWEPTSYSKNPNDVTFENGKFLQIKSRSGRWESIAVSSHGRGDVAGSGGTREMALAALCSTYRIAYKRLYLAEALP